MAATIIAFLRHTPIFEYLDNFYNWEAVKKLHKRCTKFVNLQLRCILYHRTLPINIAFRYVSTECPSLHEMIKITTFNSFMTETLWCFGKTVQDINSLYKNNGWFAWGIGIILLDNRWSRTKLFTLITKRIYLTGKCRFCTTHNISLSQRVNCFSNWRDWKITKST